MPVLDNMRNNTVETNDADKDEALKLVTNGEVSQKLIGVHKRADNGKVKGKKVALELKPIPQPLPPYPKRLKNKAEERKYRMVMLMLKKLSVSITFMEALQQIPVK